MNKRTTAALTAALALLLLGGVYHGEGELQTTTEAPAEEQETEGGIFLNGPGNGTYTGLEGSPYISYGLPKEIRNSYEVSRGLTARPKSREAGGPLTGGAANSDDVTTSLGAFKITAYTAGYESTGKRPGDPYYGVTATGTTVKEKHTIAADWKVLPPGTTVKIEGLEGVYTVEDRGGGVKGNHIDLYIADLQEALRWGVRKREITIIEWGPGYAKEVNNSTKGDANSYTSVLTN